MGNTPPKIFLSCFLNTKISLQPVNQFGWNLANLLADSFLTNRVWIFISLFVYSKLEYFFTGSASDSLSLSLTAYNKRKSALDKNLRHGVLVKRLSVKIVTLWLKKRKMTLLNLSVCTVELIVLKIVILSVLSMNGIAYPMISKNLLVFLVLSTKLNHFLVIVIYFEQISSVWGTPWLVPTGMTPSHYNSRLRFLILLRDPL